MSGPEALDGPEARAAGPEYRPEFCDKVVEIMAGGLSLTAFAGEIGVSRFTLGEWMKAHPEFAAAVERGKAKRAKALEEVLLKAETGAKVAAHVFALKTAEKEEWSEVDEVRPSNPFMLPDNGRGDPYSD